MCYRPSEPIYACNLSQTSEWNFICIPNYSLVYTVGYQLEYLFMIHFFLKYIILFRNFGTKFSREGAYIVKTAVSYTLLPGFWIYMDGPIQRYHLAVSPLPCYSVTSTPYPFSGTLIFTLFSLSFMVVRDHGTVC